MKFGIPKRKRKSETPPKVGPEPEPTAPKTPKSSEESGGPKGLEPTRYGDWERKGICVDF